ncbi:MAG: sporulation protein [Sphingopyxis macrogoltabida]|uniref:Sporulation protein n=1 Tax=Sphingopyxis macrogoltabida TaxID=33050 RepID=A0A2W5L090_SPHMC|nr:MAG: sporulation protein [Sphingopyxis macrogoltabida]
MTAKPARARRIAAALSLLLGGAMLSPGYAMQAATPDAATRAAMDKRTAARSLLSSALTRIAANANDARALLDAGRASIDLDDYRSALGFLIRAEQASPRDGTVKAALGTAMVHLENPTRALDYFGEAQLLGAPERSFAAERGLARDLLGQQDAAQRDYQMALSLAANPEITRRYALSLGISGEVDRAVELLVPQLRGQDRSAWRTRAMILAMNGRNDEARSIVNATMPPQLAENILPYLTQLDRLNPAQQAAAAHFGRFPSGPLGPPRKPVQVAAATPTPAPAPAASGRRAAERERDRRRSGTVLPAPAPTPAPAPAAVRPTPAPTPPATTTPPTAARTGRPVQPAPTEPAPGWASATPAPVTTRPAQSAAQTQIQPRTPAPASGPSTPPAAAIAQRSVPQPTPSPAPVPSAPAPQPATGPVSASPAPGFSIADIGRAPGAMPAPATPAPAPAAPPAAAPSAPSPATASAPLAAMASLADIAGSIEIPPEEMATSGGGIGADTLAKLVEDKRKADAAEAAKREKEAAAAKAKADAEAEAKAEAEEKKANPARLWVQIATGANLKALAFDYNRFAKKNAALFKGKSGATTEWGRTRRLLVGPFGDRKAAQAWLDDFKKAEGDGFLFNSEAGQSVDPVK